MDRKQIPNEPRYSFVRKKSKEFLLEMHVTQLPVDVFEIFDVMNIRCFPKRFFKENGLDLSRTSNDGEAQTFKVQHMNEYICIYDEINNKKRLYWTLLHEIAHVYLGHLDDFIETDLTKENKSMTDEKYNTLEREANFFVSLVAAPDVLLYELSLHIPHDDFNAVLLQDKLNLSIESSFNRLRNFKANLKAIKDQCDQKENIMIFRNLYSFFDKTLIEIYREYFSMLSQISLFDDERLSRLADNEFLNSNDFLPYEYYQFLLHTINEIISHSNHPDIYYKMYVSLYFSRIFIDDENNLQIICDDNDSARFLGKEISTFKKILFTFDDNEYKKIIVSLLDFKRDMLYNIDSDSIL